MIPSDVFDHFLMKYFERRKKLNAALVIYKMQQLDSTRQKIDVLTFRKYKMKLHIKIKDGRKINRKKNQNEEKENAVI